MKVPLSVPRKFATQRDFDQLCEVVRYLLGNAIVGVAAPLEVHVGGGGRTVSFAGQTYLTGRITDYASDGTNQWLYDFEVVTKTGAGYGEDNWTPTGWTGQARNRIEDMNALGGLWGNGVDAGNMVGTFDIQPAPVGCLIDIRRERNGEYWFSYENGVDGDCTGGS